MTSRILNEDSGINDPVYMTSTRIDTESKEQVLEIVSIFDIEGKEAIEVKVRNERHHEHREHYYLTRARYDESGEIISMGGFWKFRALAIACGEFIIRADSNGVMKKHIKTPLNIKGLEGKRFVGDFKKKLNKNTGDEYIRLINEKSMEEFMGAELATDGKTIQESALRESDIPKTVECPQPSTPQETDSVPF